MGSDAFICWSHEVAPLASQDFVPENSRGQRHPREWVGGLKDSGVTLDPKWPRMTSKPTIHVHDCHYNKRKLKFCTKIVIHSPSNRHTKHRWAVMLLSVGRMRSLPLLVRTSSLKTQEGKDTHLTESSTDASLSHLRSAAAKMSGTATRIRARGCRRRRVRRGGSTWCFP